MITIYKIALILFGIVLAGCFAGAETGVYCLSRFRLRLAIERKLPFAALLGRVVSDTQSLILSLSIGTNLAHYLTISIVTYMFLSGARTSGAAEIYATVIMAPILFVFAELIPKHIFIHHADALLPRLSPGIWLFNKICRFSGILPLLKFISDAIGSLTKSFLPGQAPSITAQRHHISQIIHETTEEGILTSAQSDIINRLINIPNIPISAVMITLSKVQMIAKDADRSAILNTFGQNRFTRLPVYQNKPANIVGFVNVYEVLTAEGDFDGLDSFLMPIPSIRQDSSVAEALYFMRTEKHRMALVTQPLGSEKVVGIVTIKDLAEEIVGELTI